MANFTIRPAVSEDIPAIVRLLDAVDTFYGDLIEESLEQRTSQVRTALLDERRRIGLLLACDEQGSAIGFASYSYLWPAAGSSSSIFLKELFVASDHRRSGVGRSLMRALFDVAMSNRCSRVEWLTDRSNSDARRFYQAIEAQQNEDKVVYRYKVEPQN